MSSELYIWTTALIYVSHELCIWAMSHELCVMTCACSSTRTHTNFSYMCANCVIWATNCVPTCACWSTQKQHQISSESRTLCISYKLHVLTCTCWPTKYIYIFISWALERRTAHTNLFLTFSFFLFPFFPHSRSLSRSPSSSLALSLSLNTYRCYELRVSTYEPTVWHEAWHVLCS